MQWKERTDCAVADDGNRILIQKYEIVKQLGKGTEGRVWLARDRHLDRLVAVKESIGEEEPVYQEAALLRKLEHPALPLIYDFFVEQGKTYLVMEYVEGITLRKILQAKGKIPVTQAVQWALELCEVFSYLHGGGRELVYRDLKPENIMIKSDGGLKLIDLGGVLCSAYGRMRDQKIAGTPAYCPPEQWRERGSDKTWDVYALGAVLHEMVTGMMPEQSAGIRLPIRIYDRSLPRELERIIETCTHENREKRFQSMEQLKEALLYDKEAGKGRIIFWKITGWMVWIFLGLSAAALLRPLISGVPEYEMPFPFLRAPLVLLGMAAVSKLFLSVRRRDKGILRKLEKSVKLTEKKFPGLYGMIFFLTGSIWSSVYGGVMADMTGGWYGRYAGVVYAGEKEERLWVEMRDELGRKMLLKDGAVYIPEECVRFELPADRLPEGTLSLQMTAEGEKGEVYVSRIFLIGKQ